jgi:hypothetical protein
MDWINLAQWRALVNMIRNVRVRKMVLGSSWVAAQEGLSSMKLATSLIFPYSADACSKVASRVNLTLS